jgi:hypothetical protein
LESNVKSTSTKRAFTMNADTQGGHRCHGTVFWHVNLYQGTRANAQQVVSKIGIYVY